MGRNYLPDYVIIVILLHFCAKFSLIGDHETSIPFRVKDKKKKIKKWK